MSVFTLLEENNLIIPLTSNNNNTDNTDNNNNNTDNNNIDNNNQKKNNIFLCKHNLSYILINNNIFLFKHNLSDIYEIPYIYNQLFYKYYNNFPIYISKILYIKVYDYEIDYLNKHYGFSSINRILLKNLINNNSYDKLIKILVINKRLEFLLEYIKNNNFSNQYIQYIRQTLNFLYKNTKHICLNI
jgi:hypothetical protein